MLKIGLTGGIACGKSTVARHFADLKVPVADADEVARDLVAPGEEALAAIVERYGTHIMTDGVLDRGRLREIVFRLPEERIWLESLLHPRVYKRMEQWAESAVGPYCLLVVPLLLETRKTDWVDRVLVVDCSEDLQRLRLMERDRSDAGEIDRILAAQMDRPSRLAMADDVIENTGDRRYLGTQIERLHRLYLALSEGWASKRGGENAKTTNFNDG